MAKDNYSKLDFSKVLKSAGQDEVDALRIVSVQNAIDTFFTRAIPTYNNQNSLSEIKFYLDKTRQITRLQVVDDVAGSLSGKMFIINSGGNRKKYYVWLNNGSSIDPEVPGRIGIEVPYNNNDPAKVIAYKIAISLELTKDYYAINELVGPIIQIEYIDRGLSDTAADIDAGFSIVSTNFGVTEHLKTCVVDQIPNIRIVYNPLDKTFEFINIGAASVSTTLEINNYIVTLANTDVIIPIPDGTKKFVLQVRELDCLMKVYKTSGGDYLTVNNGVAYSEENMSTVNVNFIIQTTKPNRVIELLTWS